MTAVSHPQHMDITLEVNEQIIEVFIIEKPAPRIILVTTLEVRQYELNWWVKHLRSTKHRGLATLAANNWETQHGALIACYLPQTHSIELYEPNLLLNLISIKI